MSARSWFPIESSSVVFNYLVQKSSHLYRWSYFLLKIDCLLFPIFWLPLVLWYHFVIFPLVKWFLLLLDFFIILLYLLLSVFLTTVSSLTSEHPCYHLLYSLNLFLIECLPSCLFSQICGIMWNHSLVISNTILSVLCLVYEVLWSTWDFHDLSKLQTFLWCPTDIVSILLEPPLLLIVLCHKSHSFFLPVVLSWIKML